MLVQVERSNFLSRKSRDAQHRRRFPPACVAQIELYRRRALARLGPRCGHQVASNGRSVDRSGSSKPRSSGADAITAGKRGVPRQYCIRWRIIDVGVAGRHSTAMRAVISSGATLGSGGRSFRAIFAILLGTSQPWKVWTSWMWTAVIGSADTAATSRSSAVSMQVLSRIASARYSES